MYRKSLFVYSLLAVVYLSCVLLSCIERTRYKDVYACDVNFQSSGSARGDTAIFAPNTSFMVWANPSVTCFRPGFQSFINASYATNLKNAWKTGLLVSSFKLSFDRMMVVEGDTLQPGANLLEQTTFKQYAAFAKDDLYEMGYKLRISDTLMSKMDFAAEPYIATITGNTTDNRQFSKQLTVVFTKP